MRQKPILHARDHMPGGADPLQGAVWAPPHGSYDTVIVSIPDLYAYYRLGDPGDTWTDSSGNGRHLVTETSGTNTWPLSHAVVGAIPDDDGAVEFNLPVGDADGEWIEGVPGQSWDIDVYTACGWIKTRTSAATLNGVAFGTATMTAGDIGWGFVVDYPSRLLHFHDGVHVLDLGSSLAADTWYFVAATRDLTTTTFYVNAVEVDSQAAGAGGVGGVLLRIGFGIRAGGASNWRPFQGSVDEVAIFDRALTVEELETIYASGVGALSGDEGDVPHSDGDGGVDWGPPGVEVEHGDGEEDDTPTTGPLTILDTPTSASGWQYVWHTERLVLYDTSPARFDVPPREWTRVPFNTARIWRQWEPAEGFISQAWLPDDRGTLDQARNGVLEVTSAMTFDWDDSSVMFGHQPAGVQYLEGWFAIEYPVLDYLGLPDSDPENDVPDSYNRAARLLNLRTGGVVRLPSSAVRGIKEWPFSHTAIELEGPGASYTVDQPYPQYPHWAARPLHKPLPYPQLSPTASLAYYTTSAGNPGFGGEANDLFVTVDATAGDRFVLQAWQDSPYLLRFSTNKFPNYPMLPADVQHWENMPWLSLTYYYDPELIDHDTGRVL